MCVLEETDGNESRDRAGFIFINTPLGRLGSD